MVQSSSVVAVGALSSFSVSDMDKMGIRSIHAVLCSVNSSLLSPLPELLS